LQRGRGVQREAIGHFPLFRTNQEFDPTVRGSPTPLVHAGSFQPPPHPIVKYADLLLIGAIHVSRGGMKSSKQQGEGAVRKDLANFHEMLHTGFASHFRAGGACYSEESYNPLFGLLPRRLMKWIPHVARYWFRKKHELRDYTTAGKGNGIYSVEDRVTFSLIGDWGTGTDEAQRVADCAKKFAPDFTIHLGDVYYVGDENEIREKLPRRENKSVQSREMADGPERKFRAERQP